MSNAEVDVCQDDMLELCFENELLMCGIICTTEGSTGHLLVTAKIRKVCTLDISLVLLKFGIMPEGQRI